MDCVTANKNMCFQCAVSGRVDMMEHPIGISHSRHFDVCKMNDGLIPSSYFSFRVLIFCRAGSGSHGHMFDWDT